MKLFKGITSGILGIAIFFYSINFAIGFLKAESNGVVIAGHLIITIATGILLGAILIFASYKIFRGSEKNKIESGLATIAIALIIFLLWPCRQYMYLQTHNGDFSFISLSLGVVVAIVLISRGIWILLRSIIDENNCHT
ncbi:MAG: hypothetical protein M0T70_15935 [Geobacteraceae bacterium]|nr:hypothetical protein [Geobacteraceae bacterium]